MIVFESSLRSLRISPSSALTIIVRTFNADERWDTQRSQRRLKSHAEPFCAKPPRQITCWRRIRPSPEPGSCVLGRLPRDYWGLVNERAVPDSLPDRSFRRGLGEVWALFFSYPLWLLSLNCSPVSSSHNQNHCLSLKLSYEGVGFVSIRQLWSALAHRLLPCDAPRNCAHELVILSSERIGSRAGTIPPFLSFAKQLIKRAQGSWLTRVSQRGRVSAKTRFPSSIRSP